MRRASYFKPAARAARPPAGASEPLTFGRPARVRSIREGASIKAVQPHLGHTTASITLDTYGHPFPSEMEALADRLEMVRDAALAKRARTQRGPTDNRLGETAGG